MKKTRIFLLLGALLALALASVASADSGQRIPQNLTVDTNPVFPNDTPTFTFQGISDFDSSDNSCIALALPNFGTAWDTVTVVSATANGGDISGSLDAPTTSGAACSGTAPTAPTNTQWWYIGLPADGSTAQSVVMEIRATVKGTAGSFTIRGAMNDSAFAALGTWFTIDMTGNPMVQNAAPTSRHVANTTGGCAGETPCHTGTGGLQAAIDAFSGAGTAVEVVIHGEYNVTASTTVDVDVNENITIRGVNAGSVVNDAAACSGNMLNLNNGTHSVTIKDLSFDGNANCTSGTRATGINIGAGTGTITLQDSTVRDFTTGVAGAVSFTNTNVTYRDNTTGLSVTGGTASVNGDTFTGNTTHVSASAGTLNFGNSSANTLSGGTTGISLSGTAAATIGPSSGTGSTFTSVPTGIVANSSGAVTIQNNTINGSTTIAINVDQGSPTISSNTIGTAAVGLDLDGTTPSVQGNTINNSTTAAIRLNSGGANIGTSSGNTLDNSGSGMGIDINGSATATIKNNTIKGFATAIDDGSTGTVTIGGSGAGNTIGVPGDSNTTGVSITGATGTVTVQDNTIDSNTTGLSVNSAGNTVTVKGNAIKNNTTALSEAGAGTLVAFANNFTSNTTKASCSGSNNNLRHNWWGSGAAPPSLGCEAATGVDDGLFFLGAAVTKYADSSSSPVSLTDTQSNTPDASITQNGAGSFGELVIVSHGRSDVPYGIGTSTNPCTDFFDYFVTQPSPGTEATGTYDVVIPFSDNAACRTQAANSSSGFFKIGSNGEPDVTCDDDGNIGDCWEAYTGTITKDSTSPGISHTLVAVPALTLRGAGATGPNQSGNDPTVITLSSLGAPGGSPQALPFLLLALGLAAATAVTLRRRAEAGR